MSSDVESTGDAGHANEDNDNTLASNTVDDEDGNEKDDNAGEEEGDSPGAADDIVVSYGWPNAETGRLIELWREKPILYDVAHKHYTNKPRKDRVMTAIGAELNDTCMF